MAKQRWPSTMDKEARKAFKDRIKWENSIRQAERKRIAFDKKQEAQRKKYLKKLYKKSGK